MRNCIGKRAAGCPSSGCVGLGCRPRLAAARAVSTEAAALSEPAAAGPQARWSPCPLGQQLVAWVQVSNGPSQRRAAPCVVRCWSCQRPPTRERSTPGHGRSSTRTARHHAPSQANGGRVDPRLVITEDCPSGSRGAVATAPIPLQVHMAQLARPLLVCPAARGAHGRWPQCRRSKPRACAR